MATAKYDKEKREAAQIHLLQTQPVHLSFSAALISIILDKCVQRLRQEGRTNPRNKVYPYKEKNPHSD